MEYAIITSKGSHDFNIAVIQRDDSVSYQLSRSQSTMWTNPGEHLLTITDNGSDMFFNPKMTKKMNYAEFSYAAILFDFIKNYDGIRIESYEVCQKLGSLTIKKSH
jgi:hypothetical protein